MSYTSWHTYGYGIRTDIIHTTVEKIEKLLNLAPNYKKEIHTWMQESDITKPTVDDYLDYDQDTQLGLATILSEVIFEAENIHLECAENFDCDKFLLYTPEYPWRMKENEHTLTEAQITDIFKKYVSILTDKEIPIEYKSVANGG